MKTSHHSYTVATQSASTIAINTAVNHHDVSIAQAIEQAIADTGKPSLVESNLPGHSFNEGLSQLIGRLPDASSADPSKGGDHGSTSLSGLVTAADAFRTSVLSSLDPANQDPTKKGDLHDDWIRPGLPSQDDLSAQLGHPGGGSLSTPIRNYGDVFLVMI